MKKPNDLQIILWLRQPNPQKKVKAFYRVFDIFFPALCYFANKLIHDRETAEELVLDAFLKFWERKDSFETILNVKAFLYISVRNACVNHLRSVVTERKRQSELEKYLALQFDEDAESRRIRTEVYRKLHEQIEKLPARCREILTLKYFERLKVVEIASMLNISESTVRNQIAYAVKKLKGVLNINDLYIILLLPILLRQPNNNNCNKDDCQVYKNRTAVAKPAISESI